MNQLTAYTLRLGDNCLVLSQRLGEWCGHAPELEIDLALANIGLDLLGQARNFLSYAAELAGEGDEDTLAFTRDERQFSNLLLVEQPNGNFADTIARQYFIDAWHVALFTRLMESRDPQLAAISAKAIKEAINIDTIAVGLITTEEEGEMLLEEKACDLVAYGRELLRNPNFVQYIAQKNNQRELLEIAYARAF